MREVANAAAWLALLGGAATLGGCAGHAPAEGPRHEQVRICYDRVDPEDVTGSIASLSGEELQRMQTGRIEEMIRDRLPGVVVRRLPNGDYSFRIRGTRSLVGNNEPLLVIDGLPVAQQVMQTALAGLAPSDVARIDVLKDAGSTAAYGSRGANGVILITTKAFSGH